MNVFDLAEINRMNKGTMMEWMGIEYLEASAGYIKAKMPVDKRNMQPFGLLHGGATIALAETLGSFGSALLVDTDKYDVVGQHMSANHLRSAQNGFVFGEARIIHQGKQTHVWNIDIKDEKNRLISVCRFTVMVLKRKQKP
jgi:1,4-dihydroxy-2-naphthoyl-CoA hydrolase